jgi:hypothetical protein
MRWFAGHCTGAGKVDDVADEPDPFLFRGDQDAFTPFDRCIDFVKRSTEFPKNRVMHGVRYEIAPLLDGE